MSGRRLRKTKVIATMGPACDSPEVLKEMIHAGMNVARLNFSHGSPEEHRERLEMIRRVCGEIGANVATMVDTVGIEIRTGELRGGSVVLDHDQPFLLYTDGRQGSLSGVSVSYSGLADEVKKGSVVLIDDGKLELEVVEVVEGTIHCVVVCGGTLRDRRGVNLPHTELRRSAMGPESHDDLIFAAENDVDYIAASFVQNAADVAAIRAILADHDADVPIIAKIENRAGVEHLLEIINEANGTMVARGDLGVELPVEEVPAIQKRIIRTTVMNGKPVITATQMLDSMERNPRPTRAEASDVANAILDGTSAVMLSGETAVGTYPVEAVRTMAALAVQAEASFGEYGHLQKVHPHPSNVVTEAVAQASITMAEHLKAAAIVCLTETGFTARQVSKHRPECTILAVTSAPDVVRRLAMNWGVFPILYSGEPTDEARIAFAIRRATELGYTQSGDVAVVTAGQNQQAGGTNLIRVVSV
ncbi:MAG: pyruvate kinase [Proteobacteria bacterium]|nr:pyruvate kinase [Pseudomonadota bacterium]